MKLKLRITWWFLTLLASTSVAFGQVGELIGDWTNIDPSASALTRVVITDSGTDLVVHVWGKCHPTDCDWGPVPGNVYGRTVKDNLVATAHAISAVSRSGFSETLIIAHLTAPEHLQIEIMTRFIDGSGRTSYANVGTFTRTHSSP
jgi:hypothetical protein